MATHHQPISLGLTGPMPAHEDDDMDARRWLLSWTQPSTLLLVGSLIAMLGVAHYRIGRIEKDLDSVPDTYQRRDLTNSEIASINGRLEEVLVELREIRKDLRRTP